MLSFYYYIMTHGFLMNAVVIVDKRNLSFIVIKAIWPLENITLSNELAVASKDLNEI